MGNKEFVVSYCCEVTVIDIDLFVMYFVYHCETGLISALLKSRPLYSLSMFVTLLV